jgi:hypothetical protein
MTHSCNPSTQNAEAEGQVWPELQDNLKKIKTVDWKYGSSIEHLLCKHKALISNPRPTKINKLIN